jgi:hypothetical protein
MAEGYGFPIKLKLDAGPRSTVFSPLLESPETSFISCSGCCREISGPRIIYPFAVTIVLLETSVNQEFVLGLNEKNLFEVVSGEVLIVIDCYRTDQ